MFEDYIEPKEQIHYSLPVPKDNALVEMLKSEEDFQKVLKKFELDLDNISLNVFKEISGYAMNIPVLGNDTNSQKYIAIYFTSTNLVKSIKIMTLFAKDKDFSLTFANVEESIQVTGMFQDGEYLETTISNTNEVQATGFTDCLERGFNNLPYALRAVCFASCAAVGTGVGAAACAGCLVGLGIHC
ncbi:hypothetical protein P4644_23835 [Priestia aryabhattai]|uniref:hypothetical protein n=1 Tax=Priestia aryabhattai TaxID=412384 RepID=UPI002E2090A7|nr:hypothetical protein [Priestia aryabhattai]